MSKSSRQNFARVFAIVLLCLSAVAVRDVMAATIVVTSTADDGPGSLRHAVDLASTGDTINITARGTITLYSGELLVDKNLIIRGPGATKLSVSGDGSSRVFHIFPDTIVTISGLTVTNGSVSTASGSFASNSGGGIYSDHADLTVSNCIISGNSARHGGGIFSNSQYGGRATLTINGTILRDNSASFTGGGIFSGGGFANTGESGGAILRINNTPLTNNSAAYGGGIFNDGFLGDAAATLNNSKVDNNSAEIGGGIYNNGDSGVAQLTLNYSTVNGNSYNGILNDGASYSSPGDARLVLHNSSVNSNSGDGISGFASNSGSASVTINQSTVNSNEGIGVRNDSYDANSSMTLILNGSSVSGNSTGIDNGGYGNATATITNSLVNDNDLGIANNGSDSGIATMAVYNSTVNGNNYGVYNSGFLNGDAILMLYGSTVSGNMNDSTWAGIYNDGFGGSATATLTDSSVTGNSAGVQGSGIYNIALSGSSTITLNSSTVSNNLLTNHDPMYFGGAIYNACASGDAEAMVTLNNSTVSGNSRSGVVSFGAFPDPGGRPKLVLSNSTVSGNTFGHIVNSLGSILEITNSILNAGTSDVNPFFNGTVISHGYNISSDAVGGDGTTGPGGVLNGPGDIRNTDPLLGPLKNNGGPTRTHALLANSPAIDAGDPNFDPNIFDPPMLYDQRSVPGFWRVVNGRIDIGAFEAK